MPSNRESISMLACAEAERVLFDIFDTHPVKLNCNFYVWNGLQPIMSSDLMVSI